MFVPGARGLRRGGFLHGPCRYITGIPCIQQGALQGYSWVTLVQFALGVGYVTAVVLTDMVYFGVLALSVPIVSVIVRLLHRVGEYEASWLNSLHSPHLHLHSTCARVACGIYFGYILPMVYTHLQCSLRRLLLFFIYVFSFFFS